MPDEARSSSELVEFGRQLAEMRAKLEGVERVADEDRVALCVFSGELDKLIAAFVIANGAAAMGSEVTMFFTFWGTSALREGRAKKSLLERLMGRVIKPGVRGAKLSRMQFGGGGPILMRRLMQQKGVASLEEMMELAGELGVKIYICTMSMDLLGFKEDEFKHLPGVEYCGVAGFLEAAMPSRVTLFI